MNWERVEEFRVSAGWQGVVREVGLDARGVFSNAEIKVWRSIAERENGVLDFVRGDGTKGRWHVKRYHEARRKKLPAYEEVEGIKLLEGAGIGTVRLVGYGRVGGRSFLITEDLEGFEAADKLVIKGAEFEGMGREIARVAAKMHGAGLHHRDMYLCHFFVRGEEVRVIDAGRVRRLPGWPMRTRWVVKDLAQWWYSMGEAGVSEEVRREMFGVYGGSEGLLKSVEGKARRIGAHDVNLRKRQPGRNISLPEVR